MGDRIETEACSDLCGGADVPSEDELRALNAMRTIKERVRTVKERLSSLTAPEESEGRESLEKELQRLKSDWESWEGERRRAAHERMVRLGHETRSSDR